MKRSFLLLQGVCSPFFSKLADQLVADGHGVLKVNFNVGDVAYWWPRRSISFRGLLTDFPRLLEETYARRRITDQILFGDRRPFHRVAVSAAEQHGIRTHVFEEGYFRPYWVTLEREGVNGHSLLPRDPAWFWEVGGNLPDDVQGQPFESPFWIRASHDVAYHLANACNPLVFPRYQTHQPANAAFMYAGFVKRSAMLRLRRRRNRSLISELIGRSRQYFLLLLQLNGDAQIRYHSRFDCMADVMAFVLESFAKHAPADTKLVIKNHPLDMGLVDHAAAADAHARDCGVNERVIFLEDGNLMALLEGARGVVTVNSTAGTLALGFNCPTIALSDPIYNLPGLTFQGSLDDFWEALTPPDPELFRRFRNAVIYTTQVNGGFYCARGIAMAVQNSRRLLEPDRSPLEALL